MSNLVKEAMYNCKKCGVQGSCTETLNSTSCKNDNKEYYILDEDERGGVSGIPFSSTNFSNS